MRRLDPTLLAAALTAARRSSPQTINLLLFRNRRRRRAAARRGSYRRWFGCVRCGSPKPKDSRSLNWLFLKKQLGLSTAKLLDPRSCEKRLFTTEVQELRKKVAETSSVLIFDVETTGFYHKDHRIIEFALCDLSGGKNSTFETLVNPERTVPEHIERLINIGTDLVCKPDIPRFSEVIPALLAFVRSRQAPGKPILWVAHNARFDVWFLAQEFDRCSAQIPADWLFLDTLSLARKLLKEDGKNRSIKLEALRKHYDIRSDDAAHRAMRDVMILSQVFQKMTFDLKLTYEELLNDAKKASEFRKAS